VDKLTDADPEQLVAHITVLAQFAKMAPDAFESQSDVIMAFLLKEVLMTPSPPDPVRGCVIGCPPFDLMIPAGCDA
jgi:sister chromatid cohesion protein PDS5